MEQMRFCSGLPMMSFTEFIKTDIPDHPTQEDIQEVKDEFWTIFHEFAFADVVNEPEEERENSVDYQNTILALALTIFYPTWKYGATPIWIVENTHLDSDASHLQSVVLCLGTGRIHEHMDLPKTPCGVEGLYKKTMVEKRVFFVIDNLTNDPRWECPLLLTATSEGTVCFRRPYARKSFVSEKIPFFMFNGVNLTLSDSIRFRSFVTKLDQNQNGLKCDLEDYAIRLHPRAVRGMAVLYRSWMNAGEPVPPRTTLKQFRIYRYYPEIYRQIVGMLYYAGYTNLLGVDD